MTRDIKVRKHHHVYNSGDRDEMLYFIERGQIKLTMPSLEGKECLLAIYSTGDLFGETCLAGLGARLETSTAMENSALKGISYRKLLMHFNSNMLSAWLIQYLAHRIAEQQQTIADMVTSDSEHRLGKVLLLLGRKLGRPANVAVRIEHRISHEELSQIVGTTRPRISQFMQKFRNLGLIEIGAERSLIIREKELADYLAISN